MVINDKKEIKGDDTVLLDISDIKRAFRRYLTATGLGKKHHATEWYRFWYELKEKVTVVPKISNEDEPAIKAGD